MEISRCELNFILRCNSLGFYSSFFGGGAGSTLNLKAITEMTNLVDNTIEKMQFEYFLVCYRHSQGSKTYFDTNIKFLWNLEAEIGLLKFQVSDGIHFECDVRKKNSACPRLHQADFSSAGYTLPKNVKPKSSVSSKIGLLPFPPD